MFTGLLSARFEIYRFLCFFIVLVSFAMVIYEMLNWDEEQKSYLKPWNGKSEAFVINSVSKGYRPLLPMANDTLISLMV